jgi:glyoxylase-like metal-dependent hydrolase (beta-lactamase superfamily II)
MFVTKNVYQLSGRRGARPWGANTFLLLDNSVTVVDTGLRGRAASILNEVRRLGYKPSDVAYIILTHHHADHVGSLAELKKATGAEVMAHPADAPYIDGSVPQPGPARPKWLARMLSPFGRMWASIPAEVDKLLNDGDELPILGGIKILHTPGHTLGCICLFVPQEKLVIVGDLLTNRFRPGLPSRMFTVDMIQEVNSLKKLAGLDFDIIAFGHGRPVLREARQKVTRLAEKLENKYKV